MVYVLFRYEKKISTHTANEIRNFSWRGIDAEDWKSIFSVPSRKEKRHYLRNERLSEYFEEETTEEEMMKSF